MRVIALILVVSLGICFANEDYSNPIVDDNTPDPGVIYSPQLSAYFVATTTVNNSDPNKYPIRMSYDLINWKIVGYVFPEGGWPSWAVQDFWAPEIHMVNGSSLTYAVYFAARDNTGLLCVGVAFSNNIFGPFVDSGSPLVRNESVGMIDPTYWTDEDGNQYLIWKEDGNGRNPPETYTPIWLQALNATADGLIGDRVEILHNDPSSWEGPLVEGPWIIKNTPTNQTYYYLFYSANGYAGPLYAVGVARSENLEGPYEKYPNNPILHSDDYWSGPGHCSVLLDNEDESTWFMMYHSWFAGQTGGNYDRVLMLDTIVWQDDWPTILNSVPSRNSSAPLA